MKNIKSRFVFNKSEQNGIFLLVLIIVFLQLCYYFIDFSSGTSLSSEDELRMERFQKKIDSLKQDKTSRKDNFRILPFNPNYLTDFKGYALGLTPEQIDRLFVFRKTGKFVNSAEEFQKVTGISDSLLSEISIYFKFPEWTQKKPLQQHTSSQISGSKIHKSDINSATTQDLMSLKGIGEVLAGRIINYRNKIGGFRDLLQLKDIYGLNYELRAMVEANFKIAESDAFLKLNINNASGAPAFRNTLFRVRIGQGNSELSFLARRYLLF